MDLLRMCSRYRSAKDEGYVVGMDLLRMDM